MTPIERAERAIEEETSRGSINCGDLARAALAAIEDPSEAMIMAGEEALSFVQTDDARSVWLAMHKAMMGEK